MPARTIVAALASLALMPAAAAARTSDQRALWATVNVCDTLRHPDQIGIRGSMPGADNTREQMYMRFRLQYYSASADRWRFVRKNGDSGFVLVGSAKFKARQAGQLFTIPPPPGGSFRLRGHVTFQWRLKKKVKRTVARVTTAGHHSNSGSDPDGYSSDTCVIS
jgi:hypothetical protein